MLRDPKCLTPWVDLRCHQYPENGYSVNSNWPLHLWAVSQMVPYLFASAHVDYACHGVSNLRSMKSLPTDVWPLVLQGQMFVAQRIQHGLTSSSNQH